MSGRRATIIGAGKFRTGAVLTRPARHNSRKDAPSVSSLHAETEAVVELVSLASGGIGPHARQ